MTLWVQGLLTVVPGMLSDPLRDNIPEIITSAGGKQKKLEVVSIWQKLCDGQWVIGLLAKNVSQRYLLGINFENLYDFYYDLLH